MPFRVDCPYCNAATAVAEPLAKVACSRCGETFAPVAYHEHTGDYPPLSDGSAPLKSRRLIPALLLGAVAAGLLVLLQKPAAPPAPPVPLVAAPTTVPPAALPHLRFLPAASNIILALQPAAVAAHADRTGTDVKALLGTFGVPASVWTMLEKAGVEPADVESLVAGVVLAKPGLPAAVAVLKLRQPVESLGFLKKLHAEKKPRAGSPLYAVSVAGLPVTLLPLDDRMTFVFSTTSDEELEKLAVQPRPDFAALKPALTERLSPASFAWLATDTRPWGEASSLFKLEPFKKLGATLTPLRGASVGLSLEPDPTFKVMLDLADAATAAKCVEELMKLNLDSATVIADGATVKLLAAATPATLEKLLAFLK